MTGEQWPSEEQVLKALDDAGHLLEQQVASELSTLGYAVQTNRAFEDTQEGKSREIDVWAYKPFFEDTERRLRVAVYLLVECKKTGAPLAFLTRTTPPLVRPPEEIVMTLNYAKHVISKKDGNETFQYVSKFKELGLDQHYWGTANPVKAVHISRLDRKSGEWRAANTGVFESITWPMAKALRAFKAPFANPNRGFDRGRDNVHVLLFLPVVVVASKLFVADGGAVRPKVHEAAHVRFQRELRSASLSGHFGIDFVQRESLTDFIENTVDAFGTHLADFVRADPEAVTPENRWPMGAAW